MMAKQSINPLTSRVNISSSTSSSLLSLISSSPPDLVLLCGDAGASPLLLHSAVAQSHFPAISNVLQELMSMSGPSLFWTEGAQLAISLPGISSTSLFSRLLGSIYSNAPFLYNVKEQAEVGSLLNMLEVPSHLYMVGKQKEEEMMMGEINSILDKTFSKDDLEHMLMGKDDEEPKVDLGDMEKLLEEDVDITLGENVVEVKKKEKKELKPQDEKWQKELAAAGFDPRIRRCHVDMDNLKNSELLPFVETARRNLEGKRSKLRKQQILEDRREQQRSNRERRAKGKTPDESSSIQQRSSIQQSNSIQQKSSIQQSSSTSQETSIANDPSSNDSQVTANPAETEGERRRTDFSNILNSTAIEGGIALEVVPQSKIAPITNPVAVPPKPSLEKVRVEKSPEIEFVEVREVECPDCEKRFAARAKLLGHLVSFHYFEKIFKLYPFNKGALCPLCIDSGRPKAFQIKDKPNHLRHIGQSHEAVLKVVRDEVVDIVGMFSKATKRRSTKARMDERSQDRSMMVAAEESRDSSLLPEMTLVKPEPLDMEGVIVPMINNMDMDITGEVGQQQQQQHQHQQLQQLQPMNVFEELDNMAAVAMSLMEPVPPNVASTAEEVAMPKQPEVFYCEKCDMNFNSSQALGDHNVTYEKVHTKVYQCRYCDTSSIGTRNFKDHLVLHKSEKKQRMSQTPA